MDSLVSTQRKHARPYIIIGMIGSGVAIASFFLLPAYEITAFGSTGTRKSAWEYWQEALAPPLTQGSVLLLTLVILLPLGALVTFLIGCAGFVRPLTRLWLIVFALVAWMGLGFLCLFFLLFGRFFAPDLGYFGLITGYVCMLVGHNALSRSRRGA